MPRSINRTRQSALDSFRENLNAGIEKLMFKFGFDAHEDDTIEVTSSKIRLQIGNSLFVLILQERETSYLNPKVRIPPRFHLRLGYFYKQYQEIENGLVPKGFMTDMLCLILSELVSHGVYENEALIWLEVDEDEDGIVQEQLIKKVYEPLGFVNRFEYGRFGFAGVGLYAPLGDVIKACSVREKMWSAERRLTQLASVSSPASESTTNGA